VARHRWVYDLVYEQRLTTNISTERLLQITKGALRGLPHIRRDPTRERRTLAAALHVEGAEKEIGEGGGEEVEEGAVACGLACESGHEGGGEMGATPTRRQTMPSIGIFLACICDLSRPVWKALKLSVLNRGVEVEIRAFPVSS
jgi:hypothetical protein